MGPALEAATGGVDRYIPTVDFNFKHLATEQNQSYAALHGIKYSIMENLRHKRVVTSMEHGRSEIMQAASPRA